MLGKSLQQLLLIHIMTFKVLNEVPSLVDLRKPEDIIKSLTFAMTLGIRMYMDIDHFIS